MDLHIESGRYPAGEHFVLLPQKIGKRVTLFANISEDPADLLHVLAFVDGLRTRGVEHVTLVAPWIAYGRQDRVDADGHAAVGITLAKHLTKSFDDIVTLDAHSALFREAFGKHFVSIYPMPAKRDLPFIPSMIVAPDRGAAERASFQAERFRVPLLVLEKRREGASVQTKLSTHMDLRDAQVLLVDDMVDSGGTLIAAAQVLRQAGVKKIAALITHGLVHCPKKIRGIDALLIAYDHRRHLFASWMKQGWYK